MDELLKARAALIAAAQGLVDGAKAAARDLTKEESDQLEAKLADIDNIDAQIAEAQKSDDLRKRLAGAGEIKSAGEMVADQHEGISLGEKFAKSAAYQAFRKDHPGGATSTPIHVEAKGIGTLEDLGVGAKATITTTTGQFVSERRIPGYRSTLIDEPITFLDLVTTGTTDASFIEYAQIVAETDSAALVPEGELKPLSDLTTAKADAKAYTYADGFDVTNQTLSDDGALAAFMDSRLRWHLRNKLEDVLINGDVAGPKGILNTTGTQAQAYTTDPITTLGAALQKMEAIQVAPQAIVMNPADLWAMRGLKDTTGRYLLGSPFEQKANPTPWGVPLVSSTRVTAGTAIVGNFAGVQLLMREALNVVAFNQHKDYAQRNMTYVRAELRALQFIYAPREIVVADISA